MPWRCGGMLHNATVPTVMIYAVKMRWNAAQCNCFNCHDICREDAVECCTMQLFQLPWYMPWRCGGMLHNAKAIPSSSYFDFRFMDRVHFDCKIGQKIHAPSKFMIHQQSSIKYFPSNLNHHWCSSDLRASQSESLYPLSRLGRAPLCPSKASATWKLWPEASENWPGACLLEHAFWTMPSGS